MEADCPGLLELLARSNLFFRQPNLIGKTELKLVSVAPGLLRTENGIALWQGNLADALQVVHHLLLLVAELVLVGKYLPLASTANAIMWAEGLRAAVALLMNESAKGFGIVMLLARDAKVNHITRHNIGHENDQVINADECLTFGCNILYLHFPVNGQFFLLS